MTENTLNQPVNAESEPESALDKKKTSSNQENIGFNNPEEKEESIIILKDEEQERSSIFETRLERAENRKAQGNALFKDRKYKEAMIKYRHGLYHCYFDEMSFNFELLENHREQVNKVRLPLLLNLLQCVLKEYVDDLKDIGFECANQALKIEENNSKALYRRGLLYDKIGDTDKAKADLIKAAKSDPNSVEIRKQLTSVISKLKKLQNLSDLSWKEKLSKTFEGSNVDDKTSHTNEKTSICTKIYFYLFGSTASKVKTD